MLLFGVALIIPGESLKLYASVILFTVLPIKVYEPGCSRFSVVTKAEKLSWPVV